jgi:hypothetical protein
MLPAIDDLRLTRLRIADDLNLNAGDRTILIELIDNIINDRDPREMYWRTLKGAPVKDFDRKQLALMWIDTRPNKPPSDEELECIASAMGLTFYALRHAYRAHMRASSRKGARSQSDK